MATRPPRRVRVFFGARSKHPESAWCTPLAKPHHYRLDNILFLHQEPVIGDTLEAFESDRVDGQLAFKRVVAKAGRFVMIVDYPEASGVGNLAIVKLLVEHGADPSWTSSRGNTALSIARKRKKGEVVRYLKSLGE